MNFETFLSVVSGVLEQEVGYDKLFYPLTHFEFLNHSNFTMIADKFFVHPLAWLSREFL